MSKIYNVIDGGRGGLEDVTPVEKTLRETPLQFKLGNKIMTLQEAASTSQFPQLLQSGLTGILFDAFTDVISTFQSWCNTVPSNKENEDYLRGSAIGLLPVVKEDDPYVHIQVDLDSTVKISNAYYGAILDITDRLLRYDKTGLIRQMVTDLGRAAKQTLEAAAYTALTTAASYAAAAGTVDNDVGVNTAATTFSAQGLLLAFRTLTTMKDAKSGRYLGVMPDTLIVAPGLEWAAKQLLATDMIVRAHGSTTAEIYGTGQRNPMQGIFKQIIVTPWIGTSYQWAMMEAKRAFVYQEVEPLQLWLSDVDARNNAAYFEYDRISYKVREIFGFGMYDWHKAYFSSSTTAPAVD